MIEYIKPNNKNCNTATAGATKMISQVTEESENNEKRTAGHKVASRIVQLSNKKM